MESRRRPPNQAAKDEPPAHTPQAESTATRPVTGTTDGTPASEKPTGFLGVVERVGNKLPEPFWLFVTLAGLTLVFSWLGSVAGLRAENPADGSTIEVTNLLSAEGLQRMLSEMVDNFINFPPLGVVLIVMLGIAVAEHSGFLGAAMRGMVGHIKHPVMLTFTVALVAVTGSIASDAICVIIIPLAAAAFAAAGRSPIVGSAVAFAGSSGGFNASLVPNVADLLFSGISTSAAEFTDPDYTVSPLANYFFTLPSAVVLALIVTAVTEWFIDSRAKELVDHREVDYEAATFTAPDNVDNTGEGLELSEAEKRGLKVTGIAFVLMLAAYFAFLFIPGSPFRDEDGSAMDSVLITSIGAVIAVVFFCSGIVYGLCTKSIREGKDVFTFMVKGIVPLAPMLVLFFAVSQFLAYFKWSNLGQWTAIRGAELLTSIDMPLPVLFALFVLLTTAINILLPSGAAQWALMAPVVVPMFMLLGLSPEITQVLFRIGDSATNIVTPMAPYFAVTLIFVQRYYKKAGLGTLLSLSLPYAGAILVGWFVFFLGWYYLGLPLGPGVSYVYPPA